LILGVGIDLLETHRMRRAIGRRGDRFVDRVFTRGEAVYCRRHRDPAQPFAARFAAKEAFLKALGTGWAEGISWREVEVVREAEDPPSLRLSGRAAELTRRAGVERVHLSLTHLAETAAAVVVLEGRVSR
jgi:holo-[acyl-carrier protein] synthase